MKLKLFFTVLVLLMLQACGSTDHDLEGTWELGESEGNKIQFMFRGESFGMKSPEKEIPLPENDSEKNISRYAVDKSETPHKLYLKLVTLNTASKSPFGIYKVRNNIMTFCGATEEREIRDGELTGKRIMVFPKAFKKNNCLVFTKKDS